jgi:hypothetical protein
MNYKREHVLLKKSKLMVKICILPLHIRIEQGSVPSHASTWVRHR